MLSNQMRIQYNKDSWLVSSYISEFFRMCGFVVNEEKVDYEIESCDPTEVNDNEEIVIKIKKSEINKQLLQQIINKYLADIIDITKLQPLIEVFVDFSIYEFLMWVNYYCRFENEKDVDNKNKKFINSISTIESDNNEYMRFALLYCKYKINLAYSYTKYYSWYYNLNELNNECEQLIKDFTNFKISGTVLRCLILEIDSNGCIDIIDIIKEIKQDMLKYNKALYYDILSKVYFKYEIKYNDNIKICNILLKEEPNNVKFIWNYIIFLKRGNNSKENSEVIISNIKYLLNLLDAKEKEIPLNPIELRLRVLGGIYWLEECYRLDKKFEKVKDGVSKLIQFWDILERYSLALDKFDVGQTLDLKEFFVQSSNIRIRIKDSLKQPVKKGIYMVKGILSEFGMEETEKKFVKNMLSIYSDLDI